MASIILLLTSPISSRSEEPPPVSLFALPAVTLRSDSVGTPPPAELSPAPVTEQPEELSASSLIATDESDLAVRNYEIMNGVPLLTQFEIPEERGGALGWFEASVWDPVFAPEIVQVGKVKMSGGIVAALKRRNPFCLLHPLVFVASW